jgi:NAD(P)-dependent dehydrogenase (short-subunit alcohol dehydrogenase family)
MQKLTNASDVHDQAGRRVIVTGGNSGIGFATAQALAAKGAAVILASRDLEKARVAARMIGPRAEARRLDLSSLASVREFSEGITGPVDYLINNAGAMTSSRQVTEDGFESQLGVNHLGHFALTNLLLDRVTGRVVTVSSSAHTKAGIDFDDLQWQKRAYSPFGAYGQSKLANLLFTTELQRLLTAVGSPVRATAAHPGWASTGFKIASGNRILDRLSAWATPLMAHGPEGGALPTLLATTGDVPGGSYSGPERFGVRGPAVLGSPSPHSQDARTARLLWETSEALTLTSFPLRKDAEA